MTTKKEVSNISTGIICIALCIGLYQSLQPEHTYRGKGGSDNEPFVVESYLIGLVFALSVLWNINSRTKNTDWLVKLTALPNLLYWLSIILIILRVGGEGNMVFNNETLRQFGPLLCDLALVGILYLNRKPVQQQS